MGISRGRLLRLVIPGYESTDRLPDSIGTPRSMMAGAPMENLVAVGRYAAKNDGALVQARQPSACSNPARCCPRSCPVRSGGIRGLEIFLLTL